MTPDFDGTSHRFSMDCLGGCFEYVFIFTLKILGRPCRSTGTVWKWSWKSWIWGALSLGGRWFPGPFSWKIHPSSEWCVGSVWRKKRTWIYRWLCRICGRFLWYVYENLGYSHQKRICRRKMKIRQHMGKKPELRLNQIHGCLRHRTFFRTSSSPKTPQKDRSFWGVFVAKGKAS